jgi:hypothetical protein
MIILCRVIYIIFFLLMDDNEIKLKNNKRESKYIEDKRLSKVQQPKENQILISANENKYMTNSAIMDEMNYKEEKKKENDDKEDEENFEEEPKEKEESIVDKYMFILYAVIYIVLVYSVVDISLDYNCYTSLKSIFGFSDIETNLKIAPFEIVSDIMSKINKISSLNFVLQVDYIL